MDDLTDGMTLDEQIGQLFVVGFPDQTPTPELLDLIQREHVGGVILFSRNVSDQPQTSALTHTLQSTARAAGHPAPLFVMIDQENGLVRRLGHDSTPFPGAMALGSIEDAAASERIVEEVARATAQELLAHGVNMNLAPVMDVNNAPENPVIGVRSFGSDPEVVGRLGVAAMRGLQDMGVIATLKHFPGHGDTTVDSHLALPVVTAPPERLEAVELAPFRQGIAAGAECVMSAHVAFPALTGDTTTPATLAPEALTDLLRERLGFAGVIMSDCLEMDAIAGTVGVEQGAVQTLRAGADLVLISHTLERQRAAIAAVRAAVAVGALSEGQVRLAAERVLRLKRRFLTWSDTPPAPIDAELQRAHRELSVRAYRRSVKVVRDVDGLLPLHPRADQELLILDCPPRAITAAVDIPYRSNWLVDAVRRRHNRVRALTLTADTVADALLATQTAEFILLSSVDAFRDTERLEAMRRIAHIGRSVIGLALGLPYDAESLPEVGSYLATYDYSQPALAAAASVLFGDG
ncbi:MAG TPA: beta-N-acetylhexosaminidase [Ktedonobacterales bacterium]|jgi:beta-N-acetylhexosaminidase|nr:beta-N-acetylhexosaminidase [Ktedonobacterales bacterium]